MKWIAVSALVVSLSGCAVQGGTAPSSMELPALTPAALGTGERLRVVATTTLVGDVVAQVGGEYIDLTTLMQPGQDPHSYEPAAADLALMREADVVFVNGLDFEEGLMASLDAIRADVPVVPVSAGVDVIEGGDEHEHADEGEHAGDDEHEHEHAGDDEHEHEHAGGDPHVWQDPRNVMIWTQNIASALTQLDPAHAEAYRANAATYEAMLESLDEHIRDQVERIPAENRKLVTNHDTFAYFARAYGFEVIGTVLVGASEVAEPSAGQIAALVEAINQANVPAIFVETTINDRLAQIVAEETGRDIRVLTLYTDSVGLPGSGAETYLDMMRANVATLVEGLAP